MKRFFLFVCSFFIIVTGAIVLYKRHEAHTTLALNIEALTQNEDGTKVSECYIGVTSGSASWHTACDSRTNSGTIYPCPANESYFSGVPYMCTVK